MRLVGWDKRYVGKWRVRFYRLWQERRDERYRLTAGWVLSRNVAMIKKDLSVRRPINGLGGDRRWKWKVHSMDGEPIKAEFDGLGWACEAAVRWDLEHNGGLKTPWH